jgi:hypothetical protein
MLNNIFKKRQDLILTILVFAFTLIYRVPHAGFDFINNDDGWWQSRGYAFSSAISQMDWTNTAPTYHPGVTLMWTQFFAIKAYGILNDLGYPPEFFGTNVYFMNHFLQTLGVIIVTSLLLTIAFNGLKQIVGRSYALFFILILSAEPFFTALGRTIHLDALLSISMFTSAIYYYLSIKNANDYKNFKSIIFSKNALLSGCMMGFALLTKSNALFLIPFFILILLIEYKNLKTVLPVFLAVFLIALTFFFVLWPAAWVDPIGILNFYLFKGVGEVGIEEGHMHYWFGEYTNDPGWLFYPVILLGRYSSFLIIFAVLGLILLIKKEALSFLTKQTYSFYLYASIYLFSYLLMIELVSKKMDRYSLPVIFGLVTLSIYFVVQLKLKRKMLALLFGFYLISTVVIYYAIQPYYLIYYSPLIGGYAQGLRTIEPHWPVAYKKAADYFNEMDNAENIKVALNDHFYIVEFAHFQVLDLADDKERAQADFIVLPAYNDNVVQKYMNKPGEKYNLEDYIKVAGVEVYEIYKKEPVNEQQI